MFDLNGFMQASLEHRTEAVPVPALKAWFGESEPVWVVRGLSMSELTRAQEAAQKNDRIGLLLDALRPSDKTKADKVAEIRAALGLGDDVPKEEVRRLELLVAGSVEPAIEMDTAVKLAQMFPIEFTILTNAITKLTGEGGVKPGESKPSGKTT